jgi:phosphoribosylformylglycinamidine cyclo-ligase
MNNNSFSESYKAAGVDVTAGYRAVDLMKSHVGRTMTSEVLSSIGGFGALVLPDLTGISQPVLVSGTDGVGTKLKLAFLQNKHDTVGIDCVAMCVNDIICSGARPLFFLDYLALGKNVPERVAEIVSGVAEGCVQSGCALVGGETAEMPGFYPEDEYDLAGFAVGIVDKNKIIDGSSIVPGDKLIGLASNGLHSNGFSLVRKVLNVENTDLAKFRSELGCSLGEELLKPTRLYAKTVVSILSEKSFTIKGMSHITGGGIYENLPRMLPEGVKAEVKASSWTPPAIFKLIADAGKIPTRDMYNTFNMGVGLIMAVSADEADKALAALKKLGETPFLIGECVSGEKGVELV